MKTSDKIFAQIEDWRSKLLDLTKRNRLINCKIGPTSALELVHPSPRVIWDHLANREVPLTFVWKASLVDEEELSNSEITPTEENEESPAASVDEQKSDQRRVPLDQCLASDELAPNHILTELTDAKLSTRLKRLALNAKTSIEEQGVNILFVAFGLLEWYEAPQSEVPLYSPLLLLPASLSRPGPDELWSLGTYENEVVENQCLREMLKVSFRFELPQYATNDDEDAAADPFEYFERIQSFLNDRQAAKRWRVHSKVIFGTFSFQKIAMWEDLGKNSGRISAHVNCRSIAGDYSDAAVSGSDLPAPSEFDNVIPPSEVHSVLDSDSSQFEAILAAKRGVSLVVDGPPGTGKSQTIANMIAECLAEKKTVLFVSEKSAALEVVKRRLDDQRLGDFCLECHSHKANKKQVIAELGRCLALPIERYRDQSADLRRLQEMRAHLNEYVKAIHQRRGSLQISVFTAHGRLASLNPSRQTRTAVKDPSTTSDSDLGEVLRLLKRLEECDAVLSNLHKHPWRGALPNAFSLSLQDEVRDTFSSLGQTIDGLFEEIESLSKYGLISPQPKAIELGEAIQRTRDLLRHPLLPFAWFEDNPAELARSIETLHLSEEKLRQLNQELPQFHSTDCSISASARNAVTLFRNDEYLGRLRIDGSVTVRQLKRQLGSSLHDLAHLRESVLSLRDGIANLSRHLQVRIDTNSSLGVLHKLTGMGLTIAGAGALKMSWFDPARRAELLKAEASCRQEIQGCSDIASKYVGVWANEAYGEKGEAVANETLSFESFGQRFWGTITGRWGTFYRKVRQIYLERPPKNTAALLEDLDSLRSYHRRSRNLRDVENQHKDDLVFDKQGKANWDALQKGAEVIERLQLLIKVPDKLKQVLCSESLLNREALSESANAIAQELVQIEQQVAIIGKQCAINRLGERRCAYNELSSLELEKWLEAAEQSLATLLVSLTEVESSLQPGTDIAVIDLPQAFNRLDARARQTALLVNQRERLAGISGINGPLARPEGLQSQDVEAAAALGQILRDYGARPASTVVQIIADDSVRQQVARTASVLEGIFRQNLKGLWARLVAIFPTAQPVSHGVVIEQLTLRELSVWLGEQNTQLDTLQEWIEFRVVERCLTERGLHAIIEELQAGQLTRNELKEAFLARFYRQWLDAAYWSDPVLKNFRVSDHENVLETFRTLDRDSIDGAYKRIRAKLLQDPERPHTGMLNAPPSSELGLLLRESARKRPRLPLRQLFRKIPLILRRLKPCMMMSPLAVSTFLDTPDIQFDVVIFDEASQVRPYDAIGAIYRGNQLVVAGDQKQLPPTSFFDRLNSDGDSDESPDDDEESEANISEFESILDVCCSLGMPRKRLRWHYRSRRESLIAFSNRFFYDNELITFPSVFDVEGCSAVTLQHVENGRWVPGQSGGFNPIEAKKTAALVVKHFEEMPNRSLGVITFNQRQQFAVIEELDKIRQARPELAEFFNESRREPFFVKNLENVQGDERDYIILGVAYGFDAAGKFAMRFGPLNQQGGERRLNVAVTRARYGVKVVSSIRAEEIDLSRTKARGAMLLRSYLDFAARGVEAIKAATTESSDAEHESEFEAEVERALAARGLNVRRQIGCGGFRIDLALVHPEKPGRFVLGIECDGATYHSSVTARDRDRLRQEVLEELEWRIHRIWSTDWVRNPGRQIEQVLAAYNEEIARSDSDETVHPPSSGSADRLEDEEKPILRIRRDVDENTGSSYSSIDEVPEAVIRNTVLQLLRRYGQTTREELIKSVSRQLGFLRTGRKIQQKIDSIIEQMAAQGRLSWADEGGITAS